MYNKLGRPKILLVDDEIVFRRALSRSLRAAGLDVYEANNGEDGLNIAEEIRPDLIISDVLMPKMDGNQMYKELRSRDFGRRIPFIVHTARANMREYFHSIEVDAFLEKPLAFAELLRIIQEHLQHAQARMRAAAFRRILVAGGDSSCVEKMVELLDQEGWHTDMVASGEQVLSKAVMFLPNVLVIDAVMEGMSAYENVKVLRQMPQFREMPVLVYQPNGAEKEPQTNGAPRSYTINREINRMECLKAGATEDLGEFDSKIFIRKVNRHLRMGLIGILDEDVELVRWLKVELEGEGAQVFSATDAQSGQEQIEQNVPNIILLDIRLLQKNRYELLKSIRLDPLLADVTIVLMAPFDQLNRSEIQKGMELGVEDYIWKPIHEGLLIKKIKNILTIRRWQMERGRSRTGPFS
jgi:CheY-like chemotaxis protein